MKKVLVVIGLLAGVTAYAVQFFNASDTEIGQFAKIKCGGGVDCSQVSGKLFLNVESVAGDLYGDGGDQFYGFLQNQIASTTTSLSAAQCGSTIVSNSADVMTLPEASTVLGCQYTIVCGTDDDLDINPADGTDQIGPVVSVTGTNTTTVITPSAGDAIRCTNKGHSIVLEAVGADYWSAIGGSNGTWTDVN